MLIVLDGIAVVSTYSRFPSTDLYHVHQSGTVAAGFGRELVALNFPFALVAIALVGLAWPQLRGRLLRMPRPRILDDWLEHVVKRGWTTHEVPSLLTPAANWGWVVVLVGAFAVWRLWFRQPSRTTPAPASPAISSSA